MSRVLFGAFALPTIALAQDEQLASGTLLFTGLIGVQSTPGYFGSADQELSPDIRFDILYFRERNFTIGTPNVPFDPNVYPDGFVPRLSFRYIAARTAANHPELSRLDDRDLSIEMGIGAGFVRPRWEAFADIRYGVIGHQGLIGELSANYIIHSNDRLSVRIGPRLTYGSERYNRTYFGVSPVEAGRSGFAVFEPSSGVVSASLEATATYQINDNWWLEMTARHERFSDDIARSPILQVGSRDQTEISIGFRRVLRLRF